MDNIIITSSTFADIETLWRWGEENWELWGDDKGKWFTKKHVTEWINNPNDDVLLVAKQGDTLIGMCMVLTLRDWSFCAGLFVEKEFRGQGVGKKLVDEAAHLLRQKGVDNFTILVDTKNDRAKKFYAREGFYEGYQFVMMTKSINEGI